MFVVSAVYPNQAGGRFDEQYYLNQHRTMVENRLTPFGFRALRILNGIASMDGKEPPFRIIAEMHFETQDGFASGMAKHGEEILGDAANYTDMEPVLQVSSILIG